MLTKEEAAAALNGNEYAREGSDELFKMMRTDGLVAVFGASDDLMEFRGAILDEIGVYSGGTAFMTGRGLFTPSCDSEDCPHEKLRREASTTIEALWDHPEANAAWSYKTEIPHVTFDIMEDGEVYCRGIVFALSDVAS